MRTHALSNGPSNALAMAGLVVVSLAVLMATVSNARAVDIQEVTSPGGIKAWLVEDDTADLVSMSFSFRGGSALDPIGKEGLADLVASTLDEGAGDVDSESFRRRLEDQSISISFSNGRDNFSGSFKSLNRYLDEGIDLLSLALNSPRFDEEPFERVRGQILIGLSRDKTNPNAQGGKALFKTLFDNHTYSRPAGGTEESVKAITRDDLRQFVAENLTRDRLYVGVVGKITAEALAPLLDKAFASLPESGKPFEIPAVENIAGGELIVLDQDIPQSVALFAQPGIDRDDPDFYAAYVMTHILGGGGFSSRLTEEVREKRGLAYSTYSYLAGYDAADLLIGGVSTRNDAIATSLDVIREVWTNMATEGATAEEVNDAKTYLTGSYPLRFTTTSQIARTLAAIQYQGLGIDYIDQRNSFIEAVTLEDVNRLAKTLLDPDALTVVIVGKPEGVTPTGPAPVTGG